MNAKLFARAVGKFLAGLLLVGILLFFSVAAEKLSETVSDRRADLRRYVADLREERQQRKLEKKHRENKSKRDEHNERPDLRDRREKSRSDAARNESASERADLMRFPERQKDRQEFIILSVLRDVAVEAVGERVEKRSQKQEEEYHGRGRASRKRLRLRAPEYRKRQH